MLNPIPEKLSFHYLFKTIMWSFLKGFKNLTNEDQIALQKGSKTEVMFLHAAPLYKDCLSSAAESKKGQLNLNVNSYY